MEKKMEKSNVYSKQEKLIEIKKKEMNNMISSLPEWDDSDDMRDILLSQINSKKREVKFLEAKLKITKFIDGLI